MNSDTIPITRPASVSNIATVSQKIESKYPTEIIDLPSQGYFYATDDPLSSGKVELKMMTAKEEDILTSENLIRKGTVLDRLLESLIVNKNVKVENLLIGDKNALFVAARRLAYGDEYGPIEITCPACKETNSKNINLADIKTKELNISEYNTQKGSNNFTFELPHSKRTITFKLLNTEDESKIDLELKALSKISKTSSEVTTRLKYIITSVDGEKDSAIIRKFVDTELLSKDSVKLRELIRKLSPDVDMSFNFKCENCGHEERMGVPMTVQFFWPESGV
jgi:phage FluMu protein Com